VKIDQRVPSPSVDLERVRASGDYLSLLSANSRSQIRRAARLYQSRGPLALQAASTAEEAGAIFDELVALHRRTWEARGRPGAFSPFVRGFHERLIARRFAAGEIQLLRVRAGDETIGCLYNFIWDGVVWFYQSGMSQSADPKLKPGLVCHAEAVAHNAALGHRRYDFLGGASQYKRTLATDEHRELVWARVQRPRLRFRLEDGLRRARDLARARWSGIRDRVRPARPPER
jgi:CelD/BcsL family acetyltransferase involved in cellulose biosynthesis